MKYSTIFPLLIPCLVAAHIDLNNTLIIHSISSSNVIDHEDSSLAKIYVRNVELLEDSAILHNRSPPGDISSSRSSRDPGSRHGSSPRSPPSTGTSLHRGQEQQISTGRRRVHVLQPLTFETISQATGLSSGNPIHGDTGEAVRDSNQSPVRQGWPRVQNIQTPPISSPTNAQLARQAGDLSNHAAHMPAERTLSSGRSSSTSSLVGKSDSPTATPDPSNREPEVQSRSMHNSHELRITSPIQIAARRQARGNLDPPSSSATNSGVSTVVQMEGRISNGPLSPSSSENGPVARRRRLQRRSSGSDGQQQDRLYTTTGTPSQASKHILTTRSTPEFPILTRRGKSRRKSKARGGSQAQSSHPSSVSASSSSNSLQASSSTARSSKGSQKDLRQSTSTESTGHSAGPSRTQAKNSKKSQKSGQTPSRFKGTAFLYSAKKSSRKQENQAPSSPKGLPPGVPQIKISRAGSSDQFSPVSSASSFRSAQSKTPSKLSLSRTSSGSSFYSAESDEWAFSPISPFSNKPKPLPSRVSFVGLSPGSTSPESPGSSIVRAQALESQKPPSPFADIRAQDSQSVPSPSTNRRPSPFRNAHSRAYSAPDLTSYNSESSSSPLRNSPAASPKKNELAAPLPPPSSPGPSSSRPASQLASPASVSPMRTQLPYQMSREASTDSVASSSTLLNALRLTTPGLLPFQMSPNRGPLANPEPHPASPPRERVIPSRPPTPQTQERLASFNLDPIIVRPSLGLPAVGTPAGAPQGI